MACGYASWRLCRGKYMSEPESLIEVETNTQNEEYVDPETEIKPASNRERWILYIVAITVIVLDQWSKYLVKANLELYTYYAPIPEIENFFRLSHVTNTGMAFGLFPSGGWLFTLLAPIVSIAIIIYNQKLEPGNRLLRLALGLQLGGALGNLIDRLTQGYVTDFMDFGPWPVWNIADLAVVSGTVLLAFVLFQEERQAKGVEAYDEEDEQAGEQPETIS
jgi:signal peptidase II